MNKIDIKEFDFTRFNHQVEKTQTAGKLLNYYGDLIQRIEYAIGKESIVKEIPQRVSDVPVFKNLVSNKQYVNVFNIKLNNIHRLAEEFHAGLVYLEKLTMSNTSKWLRKNFKNEIKMFANTYKEVVVKSYFDLRDKNTPIKYDIVFNFNGINPDNQGKFGEINQLTREKIGEDELMKSLQGFINITSNADIKVISKAQLLDLIEEELQSTSPAINEFADIDNMRKWKVIEPARSTVSPFFEGQKYYPKLKTKLLPLANGKYGTHYVLSPDDDLDYSTNGFLYRLKDIKMNNILNVFKRLGVDNIYFNPNCKSIYFTYFDVRIRLSDHDKKTYEDVKPYPNITEGLDVRIYWNTQEVDAVQRINREIKFR